MVIFHPVIASLSRLNATTAIPSCDLTQVTDRKMLPGNHTADTEKGHRCDKGGRARSEGRYEKKCFPSTLGTKKSGVSKQKKQQRHDLEISLFSTFD